MVSSLLVASLSRLLVSALDVILVVAIVCSVGILVRGTRTVQLLWGLVVLILLATVSFWLHLTMIIWLVNTVVKWGAIVLVIIFQPEIRHGLEFLGRGIHFRRHKNEVARTRDLIKALDHAIQYLSKRRIGALITLQMRTGLGDYIKTGIPLDAKVSGELLSNIFIPNTPLHDGAVIIKDHRVASAAAYLPLSKSTRIPKSLGTRHRAAVGISETTDALTIVISEETGEVSVTRNGHLFRALTRPDYLKLLNQQLLRSKIS